MMHQFYDLNLMFILFMEGKYIIRKVGDELVGIGRFTIWMNHHAKETALKNFEDAMHHLQHAFIDRLHWDNEELVSKQLDDAKVSTCHVLGCKLHGKEMQERTKKRFQLADIFQGLVAPLDVDQMKVRDDESYYERMSTLKRKVIVTDLPMAILENLFSMLSAKEIALASCVCSMFQHLSYEIVPGLNLSLYPHQYRALKWMLYRETAYKPLSTNSLHPYLVTSKGANINKQKVIDPVFSKVLFDVQDQTHDCRGGLFCDEPGLGKTITILALILRTQGQKADDDTLTLDLKQKKRKMNVSLRSFASRKREVRHDQLVPSKTSLIVVPNTLVHHWRCQIDWHIRPGHLKVYIDDGTSPWIPAAEELATYDIVITTFGRLSHQWQNGRPLCALEERVPDRYGFEDRRNYIDGGSYGEVSPYLRVHWVRVIVDEGHKLGGTVANYQMVMARSFVADKRWVMSGTPTPNTLQSAGLRHMHGLLVFLRDLPYGAANERAWLNAISRPFEKNDAAGYIRLHHLLSRIMIRHTKELILKTLPTPIRRLVFVNPTLSEHNAYNAIAAVVRANLVTTNMDPFNPGSKHLDSLLNPRNRRFAMEVTKNLRVACCGGGLIHVGLTGQSRVETINMLVKNNVDPDLLAEVVNFLHRAQIRQTTVCRKCKRQFQLLMLVPCGHLCCADCVEKYEMLAKAKCPCCLAHYDREFFQMLQPGFDFQWNKDVNKTGIVFTSEMIEASKALYVMLRMKRIESEREEKRGGKNVQPCKSFAEYSRREDKYIPIKVIIYSQFWEQLATVVNVLAEHGSKKQIAHFFSGSGKKSIDELKRFREDPQVKYLLMSDIGSHGLDLSFVTHIFLMDELWDKSVEEQVIARAHRMGAKHAVIVEQLVMRGTIEVLMIQMNMRENKNQVESVSRQSRETSAKAIVVEHRLKYLLDRITVLEEHICSKPGSISFSVHDAKTGSIVPGQFEIPTITRVRPNATNHPIHGVITNTETSAPRTEEPDIHLNPFSRADPIPSTRNEIISLISDSDEEEENEVRRSLQSNKRQRRLNGVRFDI
jgi:SNF2 family DNA or RNA helicase